MGTIRKKNPRGGKSLKVGNYQLGTKLGRGAFGSVYKALDLKTGQFFALKRIGLDKGDGDQMMKEINFLKNYQHHNIVRYIGFLKTEKHMNLILEFVDSGSLAQVLAGYGFFPECLAAIYISQVLEGLMYLHNQKIIHRDIKGGNLLITREGSIKLADFGIATVVSPVQSSSHVGSPFWMAPEVITDTCSTTASDIWSLGCTLIELLTGYPPYFDMVAISAVYRMVNDPCPPLPEDISDNARDFLRQCFIRDPESRTSAEQLRKHPWILEHCPDIQTKPNLPDYDTVRRTVEHFTLTREAGLHISGKLQVELNKYEEQREKGEKDEKDENEKAEKNEKKELEQMKDEARLPRTITSEAKQESESLLEPFCGRSRAASTTTNTNGGHSRTSSAAHVLKRASKHRVHILPRHLRSNSQDEDRFDLHAGELSKRIIKKGRRTTIGKFKKEKKGERNFHDDHAEGGPTIASNGASLMVANIYGVETKRSIFTFTVYKIKVMQDARMWDIERTWSDFREMHMKLETEFDNLPFLSGRKFWGVLDPEFVRKRWQELQHYLLELMKVKAIRDHPIVLNFLSANKYSK